MSWHKHGPWTHSARRATSHECSMKKANRNSANDMLPDYDFASMKGRVRGKYSAQYRAAANLVLFDPEVGQAFPTDAAENQALRANAEDDEGGPAA